jgi:Holliday junction resolvase YEN1
MQHNSLIYTSESIENTETVSLDQDGFLLCAFLLGGDYDSGVWGAGVTIAHALATQGFGNTLVDILKSYGGTEHSRRLAIWRNNLRHELRTNASGSLPKRQPRLADSILDRFPDAQIADLYINPLTSRSPGFVGVQPNAQLWLLAQPSIPQLSAFCTTYFAWNGGQLLKKLNSVLCPGVTFRMVSSVRNYDYSLVYLLMDLSVMSFMSQALSY